PLSPVALPAARPGRRHARRAARAAAAVPGRTPDSGLAVCELVRVRVGPVRPGEARGGRHDTAAVTPTASPARPADRCGANRKADPMARTTRPATTMMDPTQQVADPADLTPAVVSGGTLPAPDGLTGEALEAYTEMNNALRQEVLEIQDLMAGEFRSLLN